jgi:ATP-dependent helicase/nuclease subunit B
MSLQFYIGKTGTGKTASILDEIRTKLAESPEGPSIIYIVPDQMTFQAELELINTPGLGGMIRTQVFSFSRLAWRILQETGGAGRRHLSNVGVNMVIRKILEEKKDELTTFKRSSDKQGFIAQLSNMLKECKRYCLTPAEMAEKSEDELSPILRSKLEDLTAIYEGFEEELAGKYVDSEDYFTLLMEKIPESSYLRNAEIYVDGFYSFTTQEYGIMASLMQTCRNVTVSLTLDKPFKDEMPDPLHLFRMTGETYYDLYQIAQDNGVPIEEDRLFAEPHRFIRNESMQHLDQWFANRPAPAFKGEPQFEFCPSGNRRAEVEGIARKILKAVREGYRFRDIFVLTRNSGEYAEVVETVFTDYGIPFFIDEKRPMLNHPLIELIRSTMEILSTNWRYEPVFRAIKTDLLFAEGSDLKTARERAAVLENYVLSRGYYGDRWTKKQPWTYKRNRGLELVDTAQTDAELKIEAEINAIKEEVAEPLRRLMNRMKKAKLGVDYAQAIYQYLDELAVPAKLERLAEMDEGGAQLTRAAEHGQAWNCVMDLLDQFVEIAGERPITMKKFSAIMESGLETLTFSLIPPSLDQVVVTNLDLSRPQNVKIAFIAGLNEGVIPGRMSDDGILSDADREKLQSAGLKLAPTSKTRLLDEEFAAYKAFLLASDYTYYSYPLADDEGKQLLASSYIKRIKDLYANHKETFFVHDPAEMSDELQLEYIVHTRATLSFLAGQLLQKKKNYPVSDIWWDVYNEYRQDGPMKDQASFVLSALSYENQAKRIPDQKAQELYGETIQGSVSRMELFNSCPFAHYTSHGLRLRDREVYKLEAPDIGEMFHGALQWMTEQIIESGTTWGAMTNEQCLALARKAVELMAPKLQNEILLSSNRFHYLKRKLEHVVGRASITLSGQARNSQFSPIGLELGFGKRGTLPPLTFSLKNGTKMELAGRIDRVDRADVGDGTYLRIVDYKSSSKDLNFTEIYYGLALQMLTYLDIAVTHSPLLVGKQAKPAGVLYFHVHNPMIKNNGVYTLEQIEREVFKSFKMKGLLLGDDEVVKMMDSDLEGGESLIVPAGFKKDGTFTAASKIASEEEFSLLSKHVKKIYTDTGTAITSGVSDIKPYRLQNKMPCTFCQYKTVCQFDPSLETNEYRILKPSKKEAIFAALREEEEADE